MKTPMSRRCHTSRLLALLAAVALLSPLVRAGQVFAKLPSPAGGVNASSWVAPDGSDSDMYAWDDFTLPLTQAVTEVRWRGGYALGAPFGAATDFRVSFFASIAGGSQPLIVALPEHESQEITLGTFHTLNNAGETLVGVFGGVSMYDYRFVLPSPVVLAGGEKYWFRVVASQVGYPDWGMATASGGGSHFRYSTGMAMFQNVPNDMAFSLHARWADLGHALAGTAGSPVLAGSGTLAGSSSCSFSLSAARPSAAAMLIFGFTQLNFPLKGGVLVPVPQLLVPMPTNASGTAGLPFVMPPVVPPGVDLVLQVWIPDPAGVQGLAASNGLVGTTP